MKTTDIQKLQTVFPIRTHQIEMGRYSPILLPLFAFLSLLFTGCSSIVDGGSNSHVQINSNPSGAKLSIYNKDGDSILV